MKNPLKSKIAGMLIVALCAALVAPAVAGAQDPTSAQYDNELTQISTGANPPAEASGLDSQVGPLPFTGFDVIAMAAVALAVTGLGLALQRAVSRQTRNEVG